MWKFFIRGGGFRPILHFLKCGNGGGCDVCAFLPFLGHFLPLRDQIFFTLWGVKKVWKISTLFIFFFEGFPYMLSENIFGSYKKIKLINYSILLGFKDCGKPNKKHTQINNDIVKMDLFLIQFQFFLLFIHDHECNLFKFMKSCSRTTPWMIKNSVFNSCFKKIKVKLD